MSSMMLSRPAKSSREQPPPAASCSLGDLLLDDSLGLCLDINKPDNFGQTPVAYAMDSERKECVQACLKMGADVASMSVDGYSKPLHWAASRGHMELLQLMIDKGADPAAFFSDGCSVLHWAVKHNFMEMVTKLIGLPRVDVNVADVHRRGTPLHDAAELGRAQVARLLVEAGPYTAASMRRDAAPRLKLWVARPKLPGERVCTTFVLQVRLSTRRMLRAGMFCTAQLMAARLSWWHSC